MDKNTVEEELFSASEQNGLVLEDKYAFTGSEKNLREMGTVFAPGLNGLKARLKLILALSYTRDLEVIRSMFNTPIEYGQGTDA